MICQAFLIIIKLKKKKKKPKVNAFTQLDMSITVLYQHMSILWQQKQSVNFKNTF